MMGINIDVQAQRHQSSVKSPQHFLVFLLVSPRPRPQPPSTIGRQTNRCSMPTILSSPQPNKKKPSLQRHQPQSTTECAIQRVSKSVLTPQVAICFSLVQPLKSQFGIERHPTHTKFVLKPEVCEIVSMGLGVPQGRTGASVAGRDVSRGRAATGPARQLARSSAVASRDVLL